MADKETILALNKKSKRYIIIGNIGLTILLISLFSLVILIISSPENKEIFSRVYDNFPPCLIFTKLR